MGIFIKGISICPICDKTIEDDNYEMFPPLISNTKDPLFLFSDSVVHKECLKNHPLKNIVLEFRNRHDVFLNQIRTLLVTGQIKYTDIVVVGLLTSRSDEELYKFNFTIVKKEFLNDWLHNTEFIRIVNEYLENDKWISESPFNYLVNLIKELRNLANN